MKKASPTVELSLTVIAVLSFSINAQPTSQNPKPIDKSVTAYKSSESEERKSQSGTNESRPATNQDANSSAASRSSELPREDSVKPGTAEASVEAQKLYESGTNLYEAGKIEAAIAAFRQAVQLKPDDSQTHYSLGMAYSKSKSYNEAAESFKRAVRFRPDWPEANFRSGMMSYVLGRKSQSIEAYNKLQKLDSPLANKLFKIINEVGAPAVSESASLSDELTTKSVEIDPVSSSTGSSEASTPIQQAATRALKETDTTKPAASDAVVPVSETTPPAQSDDQTLTKIYRVGVGDVLDIRLLNSIRPGSTLYTVLDGGLIDLPIAGGAVSVGELTTDEIQNRIAAELKRRAVEGNSPVSVGVRQYASHMVIVTGLVMNQGTRVLRREAVPLYVVLAEVQPRLDAGRVTIMREGGGGQTLDLSDSTALGALIRPGDVINVSLRPQEFYYIAGRVTYPGQKPFQSGITLLQAILAAGGMARQGDDTIDLSREGVDGHLTTTRYSLKEIKSGKTQDPKLRPGDRIEVVR